MYILRFTLDFEKNSLVLQKLKVACCSLSWSKFNFQKDCWPEIRALSLGYTIMANRFI